MTIQEVEEVKAYLTNEKTRSRLKVKYNGEMRTLFYNSQTNVIGIIAKGSRNRGYVFDDFLNIERVYYPKKIDPAEANAKLVDKYKKLAEKASFTNAWLRDIAVANPKVSLYENKITTGVSIDGQCISLKSIERYCGEWIMQRFLNAVKDKVDFNSLRFDFRGYDGTLWVSPHPNGTDVTAGFSKEYRNCGNGYYYLLINDDYVIGYDID